MRLSQKCHIIDVAYYLEPVAPVLDHVSYGNLPFHVCYVSMHYLFFIVTLVLVSI